MTAIDKSIKCYRSHRLNVIFFVGLNAIAGSDENVDPSAFASSELESMLADDTQSSKTCLVLPGHDIPATNAEIVFFYCFKTWASTAETCVENKPPPLNPFVWSPLQVQYLLMNLFFSSLFRVAPLVLLDRNELQPTLPLSVRMSHSGLFWTTPGISTRFRKSKWKLCKNAFSWNQNSSKFLLACTNQKSRSQLLHGQLRLKKGVQINSRGFGRGLQGLRNNAVGWYAETRSFIGAVRRARPDRVVVALDSDETFVIVDDDAATPARPAPSAAVVLQLLVLEALFLPRPHRPVRRVVRQLERHVRLKLQIERNFVAVLLVH